MYKFLLLLLLTALSIVMSTIFLVFYVLEGTCDICLMGMDKLTRKNAELEETLITVLAKNSRSFYWDSDGRSIISQMHQFFELDEWGDITNDNMRPSSFIATRVKQSTPVVGDAVGLLKTEVDELISKMMNKHAEVFHASIECLKLVKLQFVRDSYNTE
jgi:hypothetical protein